MKEKKISTFKVAATYIGTIVGAGFATGQEVLQFFTRFGEFGLLGLLLVTIMFAIFGYIIMDLGRKLNVHSHLELIEYSSGKFIGKIIDIIITFFLFGALTAMIAGTGALFAQELNLPSLLGNVIMAVITIATVLTGINGVINSISFVVPFLLITLIGTSIFSIINIPPDIYAIPNNTDGGALISNNWIFAAILYVSYNTILSIAVLGPLGIKAKDNKTIRNGAILGGLGLGISSLMIFLALSGSVNEIENLEVPMIYIAGKIAPSVQFLYAIILIAEVYTTAVGALYGFVSRMTDIKRFAKKEKIVAVVATILALLASQIGFSNMVKYMYSLVGYGGIILLTSLIYSKFINKKIKNIT